MVWGGGLVKNLYFNKLFSTTEATYPRLHFENPWGKIIAIHACYYLQWHVAHRHMTVAVACLETSHRKAMHENCTPSPRTLAMALVP